MIVQLTDEEMAVAEWLGEQRHKRSEFRQARYGGTRDKEYNIAGCVAECAVAKYLDVFWMGGSIGAPDVGEKTQVRSTDRPDGHLLVHPKDPDDAPFVLVTGTRPVFVLAGWLLGRDCKQQKWWRENTGRPAFFVPQAALHPIEELRGMPVK